ncbi:hypothetical protein I601_3049 [Nocardioides dokdonensis FR1436]|uniref:SseB protein N-terminal domain-containing protein n=1 Tax=Nocardioides dokdonensis FR1436 TaxID=1300347 RepID=A0A1A9GP78_9ACTN|nr:SseB family protein [Nocardioides dokdonensis]ANH39460.1 hypothetical protein I601_3049 [Nocardioides dokdonensis FR1436]
MDDQHQHQRLLAGPGFPGDTGGADAALTAALAAYDAAPRDPDTYLACLDALTTARLLVPVVALLGEVEVDERGLARDKSSDMAAVLLTGADGRTALLSFTSTETMAGWDPQARPVPVTAPYAAQAAVQEEAAALLVDVAGPVRLVVEGADLEALGAGWTPVRVGTGIGWLRPTP